MASTFETNSSSRGAYTREAALDTNMVIILAALLCALILALGLNSIMRCAMRCTRTLSSSSTNSTSSTNSRGLKKKVLRGIPVAVYRPDLDIPATDCPICLAEFSDGERVRVLPRCHHGFHVTCIDIWLLSHSSCPTCRQSLLDHLLVTSLPPFHGEETTILVDEVS